MSQDREGLQDRKGSPIDYYTGNSSGRSSAAKYRPRALWQRAVDYFEFMRERAWQRPEAIKGGDLAGSLVYLPTQTPLDLRQFLIFAGISRSEWRRYKSDPAFADICDRVEMMIETHDIEGAMVGAYNSNFTARLLGMADRTEATVEVRQPRDLTPEEAAALYSAMEEQY